MSEHDVTGDSPPQDQRTEEEVAAASGEGEGEGEGDGESSPPVRVPFVTGESETGMSTTTLICDKSLSTYEPLDILHECHVLLNFFTPPQAMNELKLGEP